MLSLRKIKRIIYVCKLIFLPSKDHDGIMIIGDQDFINNIICALDLLRKSSRNGYDLVKKYIGIISLSKSTGMLAYLNPPLCEKSRVGINDPILSASSLVHEAFHSKLYNDYKHIMKEGGRVPSETWTGEDAERKCIAAEIGFLREIGADDELIKEAENAINTKYWEIPEEKRDW